jgi:hypothetical protein
MLPRKLNCGCANSLLAEYWTFLVEDRLRARDARFVSKADLPNKNDAVIDERVVMAMFLSSSAIVAEEMVRLLQRVE